MISSGHHQQNTLASNTRSGTPSNNGNTSSTPNDSPHDRVSNVFHQLPSSSRINNSASSYPSSPQLGSPTTSTPSPAIANTSNTTPTLSSNNSNSSLAGLSDLNRILDSPTTSTSTSTTVGPSESSGKYTSSSGTDRFDQLASWTSQQYMHENSSSSSSAMPHHNNTNPFATSSSLPSIPNINSSVMNASHYNSHHAADQSSSSSPSTDSGSGGNNGNHHYNNHQQQNTHNNESNHYHANNHHHHHHNHYSSNGSGSSSGSNGSSNNDFPSSSSRRNSESGLDPSSSSSLSSSSSSINNNNNNNNFTDGASILNNVPGMKPKRTQVPKACANCRKKKAACDRERPCKRCIAGGEESTCVDLPRKKRGPSINSNNNNSTRDSASTASNDNSNNNNNNNINSNGHPPSINGNGNNNNNSYPHPNNNSNSGSNNNNSGPYIPSVGATPLSSSDHPTTAGANQHHNYKRSKHYHHHHSPIEVSGNNLTMIDNSTTNNNYAAEQQHFGGGQTSPIHPSFRRGSSSNGSSNSNIYVNQQQNHNGSSSNNNGNGNSQQVFSDIPPHEIPHISHDIRMLISALDRDKVGRLLGYFIEKYNERELLGNFFELNSNSEATEQLLIRDYIKYVFEKASKCGEWNMAVATVVALVDDGINLLTAHQPRSAMLYFTGYLEGLSRYDPWLSCFQQGHSHTADVPFLVDSFCGKLLEFDTTFNDYEREILKTRLDPFKTRMDSSKNQFHIFCGTDPSMIPAAASIPVKIPPNSSSSPNVVNPTAAAGTAPSNLGNHASSATTPPSTNGFLSYDHLLTRKFAGNLHNSIPTSSPNGSSSSPSLSHHNYNNNNNGNHSHHHNGNNNMNPLLSAAIAAVGDHSNSPHISNEFHTLPLTTAPNNVTNKHHHHSS